MSRWQRGGGETAAPQGLPLRGAALLLVRLPGVRARLAGVPAPEHRRCSRFGRFLLSGPAWTPLALRSAPGVAWPFGAGRPRRRSPRSPRGFVGVASRRSRCGTCVAGAAVLPSCPAVRERPRPLTVGCGVPLVCPAVQLRPSVALWPSDCCLPGTCGVSSCSSPYRYYLGKLGELRR